MKHFPCLSIAVAAFVLAALPTWAAQPASLAPAPHNVVYGYYCIYCQYQTGGHPQRYTIKQIAESGAAAKMTALYYAFGRVVDNRCRLWFPELEADQIYGAQNSVDGTADPEGDGHLRGIFHQLQELKQRYPNLKVIMSLGGGGLSQGFPSAAEPQNLRAFVHSCVQMYIVGHVAPGLEAPGLFDGIDLDWEMPVTGSDGVPGRPEDTRNYVALAREFRRQLDAVRPGLLLTAALPAGERNLQYFDLKDMSKYMNDLAIMGYDMASPRDPITDFGSALFADPANPTHKNNNDVFAINYLLRAGLPADKILLGVPFGDGRHWVGVKDINHGLYQPAQQAPRPAAAMAGAACIPRVSPWDALPASADRQYWLAAGSCSAWYDGNFYSFDCPQAMATKTAYVRSHGLGGVMFWELTADPGGKLLDALTVATAPGNEAQTGSSSH